MASPIFRAVSNSPGKPAALYMNVRNQIALGLTMGERMQRHS